MPARKSKVSEIKEFYTLTFGDVAENHVGMQKIGSLSERGFDEKDMIRFAEYFSELGCKVELKPLHFMASALENSDDHKIVQGELDPAFVLVIRDGVNRLLNDPKAADKLYIEQTLLDYDSKAMMKGKVVNKHARHNLCFGESDQDPDYESGKGRVYNIDEVPDLNSLKEKLKSICRKCEGLVVEGNYYFDVEKCGIGYHGDAERRKVIAIRLYGKRNLESKAQDPDPTGDKTICYAWYKGYKQISNIIKLDIGHGDIYIMSEKATGFDWKRPSIPTLRHAAGCDKYTSI